MSQRSRSRSGPSWPSSAGYGILRLGLVPTGTDLVRLVAFFLVAVVYISLWLALSILLSVVSRRAATTALATIALWLVLTLFAGLISGIVADSRARRPADATTEQVLANARLDQDIRRLSPDQLYEEATQVLLDPSQQSTGHRRRPAGRTTPSRAACRSTRACRWRGGSSWSSSPLTVIMFAAAYTSFMRQEVRA